MAFLFTSLPHILQKFCAIWPNAVCTNIRLVGTCHFNIHRCCVVAEYYVHLLRSCVAGFIQLAMPLVADGLAGTRLDGNLVPPTATRQTSGVATRLGWTDGLYEGAGDAREGG